MKNSPEEQMKICELEQTVSLFGMCKGSDV